MRRLRASSFPFFFSRTGASLPPEATRHTAGPGEAVGTFDRPRLGVVRLEGEALGRATTRGLALSRSCPPGSRCRAEPQATYGEVGRGTERAN